MPTPAGYYCTLSRLYVIGGGAQNIADYSDTTASGTLDTDQVQAAMDDADAEVDARLRFAGLTAPAALTDDNIRLLSDAAGYYAVAALYRSRANRDEADGEGGKRGEWLANAERLVTRYVVVARMGDRPRQPSDPTQTV